VPAPQANGETTATISPAQAILPVLADRLSDHGLDLRSPVWEQSCSLALTNVHGSMCEINLTGSGAVIWEYRPFHGTVVVPAQAVDMVMTLLAADPIRSGLPFQQRPGWSFKAAVGRILARQGLSVALRITCTDEVNYEVYAEVEVTNPTRLSRGTAWVGDDHSIRWQCHLPGPLTGTDGLTPEEIANTIAATLTCHTI
jgi:hypothetical protein